MTNREGNFMFEYPSFLASIINGPSVHTSIQKQNITDGNGVVGTLNDHSTTINIDGPGGESNSGIIFWSYA